MVGGEVLSIFLGITTLLQSVAIFIQAIVFQKVYITTANIKFFISVLLICATFCMIWKNKFYNSLKKARIILFFVVFMLYNLIIMLIYSIPQVGLSNTFKAYFYNFSLLILIFPLWYLQIFTHKVYVTEMHIYSKRFLKLLAILILVLDVFGVFQYLFNDYLINNMIVSLLIENDYIKFDHIGSQIRANSFFKSPLEFGIFNCYFATYMAHKIIANNKVSMRNNLILVLFILSVIATVSRTAMVMLFVCIVMVLILDYGKIQNRYLFLLNVMSISILLIMCLEIIYIYKSGYGQISVSDVHTNPTNFFIRLQIWKTLLERFVSIENLMVGFGIVQNGSYGYYHSVIVDNIYLGVFLMGGAVGVFLFLINIYYTFKMTYIKYLQTGKLENVCGLAFFVAFLAGGMTENLMHLMYYPYIALMIEKFFNALTYNQGCEVL